MRPKLKPDVYWVAHPEGVAFVHPSAFLNVKGRTALALMDRLAPYLDGATTLDELVTGLPDGKKDMVVTLVTALQGAGLVKDVTGDQPHGLSPAELECYAAEIAYIDYYLGSAAQRFERYRLTPAVCIGSGLTFAALVHASLRSGLAQVTALMSGDCRTDAERLAEYAELAAQRDPAQRLAIAQLAPGTDGLRAAVLAGGLVLHAGDSPSPARARELDRLCRQLGRVLVQGIPDGDAAWTGPVTRPDGPDWESAWLHRAANAAHRPGADAFRPQDSAPSPYLAGPTASIVASRTSFLAFRQLTGIADADAGASDPAGQDRSAVSRIDLETLQTTEHRYHRHPGSAPAEPETESSFAGRWAALLAATAPDADAFSTAAAGCFDPLLGTFAELDEEELPQVPLYVSRATVADPFRLLDTTDGPVIVTGSGASFAAARRAAGEAAVLAYAALAVDRRRLHSPGEPRGDRELAFAHNLILDKPELIGAQLAYPALAAGAKAASSFQTPAGLASGADLGTALARGLLGQAVALTAAAAALGGRFPRVELDELAADEPARRYLKILRLAEISVEAFDVTGPAGIRVYALCTADRTVSYAAGGDLATGLAEVLTDYQGVTRPRPVPQLPPGSRGTGRVAAPGHPGPSSWRDLAEVFSRLGYKVHALPAGHDPAVTRVLPTMVQVAVHA